MFTFFINGIDMFTFVGYICEITIFFFGSEKGEIFCEISILNVSDLIAKKAKICISWIHIVIFNKDFKISSFSNYILSITKSRSLGLLACGFQDLCVNNHHFCATGKIMLSKREVFQKRFPTFEFVYMVCEKLLSVC